MGGVFADDSFHKEGDRYVKSSLATATITGGVYETVSVGAYQDLEVDTQGLGAELLEDEVGSQLKDLGASGIEKAIQRALGAVEKKRTEVFGAPGEEPTYLREWMDTRTRQVERGVWETVGQDSQGEDIQKLVTKSFQETYKVPDSKNLNKAEYDALKNSEGDEDRIAVTDPGQFGQHVGYAPKFRKDANPEKNQGENTLFAGKGETGRLIGWFQQYKLQEGAAYAELNKPSWDRKLWDDRGQWFKAVSLKTVVDVGVGVAVTLSTGGAGAVGLMGILGNAAIATAYNLVDDVAFAALDVGGGYKSFDQAAFDVGKKGLTSFATSTISGFGKDIMGTMGGVANAAGDVSKATGLYAMKGLDGVVTRSLFQVGQQVASNLTSSAIGGIQYTSGKGWGYDTNALGQGVVGTSALGGYLSSFAGNLTEGLLGQYNLTDNNGNWLNNQTYGDLGNVKGMNAFAGSMVSTGLTYGMTGNADLNVVNWGGGGLMEMHLGKQGFSMNFGTGGTDVSLGTIASAMGGLQHSNQITDFKYGVVNANDGKTFDAINGLGYTSNPNNWAVGSMIFNRDIAVNYDSSLGRNQMGYVDPKVPGVIGVNDDFLGLDGPEGAARLASVLAHEGSHLSGKDREIDALKEGLGSYGEVLDAWGAKADSEYTAGTIAAMMDPASWQKNPEGAREYLTILANGTIIDDKSKGINVEVPLKLLSRANLAIMTDPILKKLLTNPDHPGSAFLSLGTTGDDAKDLALAESVLTGYGPEDYIGADNTWSEHGYTGENGKYELTPGSKLFQWLVGSPGTGPLSEVKDKEALKSLQQELATGLDGSIDGLRGTPEYMGAMGRVAGDVGIDAIVTALTFRAGNARMLGLTSRLAQSEWLNAAIASGVRTPASLTAVERQILLEQKKGDFGVSFFGDEIAQFYLKDGAKLGPAGKNTWMIPLGDAKVVTSVEAAARETGMADSITQVWLKGQPGFGLAFPLEGLTFRIPSAVDAGSWPHFLAGGRTAIAGQGFYMRNYTREFVTPGGGNIPKGSVLFQIMENGTWKKVRSW